jgi:cysteine sulfinate desulfinase/cysteine desulfurase-like protein
MGVDRSWAAGALRMSLGRTTTEQDVDTAVAVIGDAVRTLRERMANVR